MMRLDKFLTVTGTATRSESAKAIKRGAVLVDGIPAKTPALQIDPESNVIVYEGVSVVYRRYTYIMMNKPEGLVSATEDSRDKTVLSLLPEKLARLGLFPCGRLDKNTTGLLLLTDNGSLAHRLLAPKSHVEKCYEFTAEHELSKEDVMALENGVYIAGGHLTKPARITLKDDEKSGTIIITEGKYHQIKLMLEAVNNRILTLGRLRFGSLTLDKDLARGEWRFLTDDEIKKLELNGRDTQ